MVTHRKTIPPPEISDELIRYLEEKFSDRIPSEVEYSEREVFMRMGTRRVIDHLRSVRKKNEKNESRKPHVLSTEDHHRNS